MSKINVKECKMLALRLAGEDVAYEALSSGISVTDKAVQSVLSRIHTATEIVASEIFTDYFQAVKKETVKTRDKAVRFEDLSERIVEIKSVRRGKAVVRYEMYHDRLEFEREGEYEITYVFLPLFTQNTAELDIQCGKITSRVVALGICAEYCLMSDRLNDANAFNALFKDGLLQAEKSRVSRRIKRRTWA